MDREAAHRGGDDEVGRAGPVPTTPPAADTKPVTLRYDETVGKSPAPARTAANDRASTPGHVERRIADLERPARELRHRLQRCRGDGGVADRRSLAALSPADEDGRSQA